MAGISELCIIGIAIDDDGVALSVDDPPRRDDGLHTTSNNSRPDSIAVNQHCPRRARARARIPIWKPLLPHLRPLHTRDPPRAPE